MARMADAGELYKIKLGLAKLLRMRRTTGGAWKLGQARFGRDSEPEKNNWGGQPGREVDPLG